MKWEYHTGIDSPQSIVNMYEMGQKGWECYSVYHAEYHTYFYFKRPISEPEPPSIPPPTSLIQ